MHVLSVIHGTDARAGLFAPVVDLAGHTLDEWSFAWGTPPPRPLDSYDAVLVFGGAMHADQDAHHPWLNEESLWLQQVLDRHTRVLAETRERIGRWNELGRTLCSAFLDTAERALADAA